ncbi:uncharacterized protein LOC107847289 [Capsicum annuum]|uniref:uncharacterized protein LOC107847289 n=1 Tax=Capsicum annuum TaxID=4072 RepID=UPI001FB10132|nr:uncharacterized protein LOC107847289 [Capsicum annuum]XP_047255423.1 uncharacterized protein LOC107847289 [Capsicum annuum]
MVTFYRPAILFLLKIKMSEHKSLTKALGYDAQVQSSVVGLTEGTVIMWKEDHGHLDNFTVTTQGIHVIVKIPRFRSIRTMPFMPEPEFAALNAFLREYHYGSLTFKAELLLSCSFLRPATRLKAHFQDNPKDLDLLKHDKKLRKKAPSPHLRDVPDYLLDPTTQEASKIVKLARAAMGNTNPSRGKG